MGALKHLLSFLSDGDISSLKQPLRVLTLPTAPHCVLLPLTAAINPLILYFSTELKQ